MSTLSLSELDAFKSDNLIIKDFLNPLFNRTQFFNRVKFFDDYFIVQSEDTSRHLYSMKFKQHLASYYSEKETRYQNNTLWTSQHDYDKETDTLLDQLEAEAIRLGINLEHL